MGIIDHEEKLLVANNMMEYGGSFIKKLGSALLSADYINTRKIYETWPEKIKEYKEIKKR